MQIQVQYFTTNKQNGCWCQIGFIGNWWNFHTQQFLGERDSFIMEHFDWKISLYNSFALCFPTTSCSFWVPCYIMLSLTTSTNYKTITLSFFWLTISAISVHFLHCTTSSPLYTPCQLKDIYKTKQKTSEALRGWQQMSPSCTKVGVWTQCTKQQSTSFPIRYDTRGWQFGPKNKTKRCKPTKYFIKGKLCKMFYKLKMIFIYLFI